MLNRGEWLGGGCEDARDKVRKDDVGMRRRLVGQVKKSDILRRTVNPDVRGPVGLYHRMEDESEITLTDREK